MERRTSFRTAIKHEAILILPSGAKWPCTIADFCTKGLFLSFSMQVSNAINAALSSLEHHPIHIQFDGEDGQSYTLDVDVARRIECALGVRLLHESDAAIEALKELATHQGSQAKQELTKEAKEVIGQCTKETMKHCAANFSDVFPLVVDCIKDAALKAQSDQDANALMELSEKFRRKQISVNEQFLQAVSDPVAFLRSQAMQHQDVSEHLSIVDKIEFEDWLLSRVVITKFESQFRNELLVLKLRLDSLGMASDDKKSSHYGPELFVLAFRNAMSEFITDSKIERLLFKQFETAFMSGLEPLYKSLNTLLIVNGVLPDLDVTKAIKKKSARKQPAKPTPSQDSSEDQDNTVSGTDMSGGPAGSVSSAGTGHTGSRQPALGNGNNAAPSSQQNRQTGAGSGVGAGSGGQPVDAYADTFEASPLTDLLQSFGTPDRAYGQSSDERIEMPSALDGAISDTSAPFRNPAQFGNESTRQSIAHYNQQASEAFAKVKGLMQSLRAPNEETADETQRQALSDEKYTAEELNKGLTSLQVESLEQTEPDSRGLLERVLGNVGDEVGEQKGIDEEQQVAIDVVDRFFDSLKRNPRLTSNALDQLNKLEVPMLKSLLKDENFFSENNSTLRQIMNRLAQLGSKGSRMNPATQRRVESLVQQVAENHEHNEAIFAEVLEELEQLLDRQSAMYSKNAERVATAAEGLFRAEQSRIAVAQSLNKLMGGNLVPRAIQVLLDSGWRDLLSQLHIKHGANSSEYKEHFNVLVELLGYGEKPGEGIELKALLPKIQEGLAQATGATKAPENVRRELKDFIEKAPKQQHAEVESKPEPVEEPEELRESRNTKVLKELKPWIKRARAVQMGSWLRLHKEGKEIQYMRLVWVAQGYSKFVFVNHQGMKVVELGLFKFARYIRDQVIAVDSEYEVPIVNQSLDDMVKGVYDRLAYESSHDPDSDLLNKNELLRQIRLSMASGDLAASCGLICVRVWEVHDDQPRGLSSKHAAQLGDLLSELVAESSVRGRLSEYDFVIFTKDDDMDLLVVSMEEKLSVMKSDLSENCDLAYQLAEHRSSIGFNNPESMIQHVLSELKPVEKDLSEEVNDTDDERLIQDETAVTQHAVEQYVQGATQASDAQVDDPNLFEIYFQRSIGIAPDTSSDGQAELVCSERGTNLSYLPGAIKEAQFLDNWWLERLINRYSEPSPNWDSLGEIRVKLSGFALMDDEFVDKLAEMAEDEKVRADEIWFDIYDSASITDVHAASDRIDALGALGYRFCLDHFGSTRAPFYLMKSLPVHMIKIDQHYIDSLNKDEESDGPTGSIVEVAHYLKRKVLASSVDTAICLQKMRTLGLDYAQGDTISSYELLEA